MILKTYKVVNLIWMDKITHLFKNKRQNQREIKYFYKLEDNI
jgi:hypothetical protein